MNTYTPEKPLVDNPSFQNMRSEAVQSLDPVTIDRPIRELIRHFNALPYVFTLQSCYGHFLYPGHEIPDNLDPLPPVRIPARIKYRIAYLAFCVQNSLAGSALLGDAREIVQWDPQNIQFGCAEWFWRRHLNSYVLQVEPERFKQRDRARLDFDEAVRIEATRNVFFRKMDELLKNHLRSAGEP